MSAEPSAERTGRYLEALLDRHLKDLKFSELTRALRACLKARSRLVIATTGS